jgi:hypothetical protein
MLGPMPPRFCSGMHAAADSDNDKAAQAESFTPAAYLISVPPFLRVIRSHFLRIARRVRSSATAVNRPISRSEARRGAPPAAEQPPP